MSLRRVPSSLRNCQNDTVSSSHVLNTLAASFIIEEKWE